MLSLSFPRPFTVQVDDLPRPSCPPDGVVVKVHYCGICGSDIELFRLGEGEVSAVHAGYKGHEFCGVVTEVGQAVHDVQVGEPVTTGVVSGCGQCANCRLGKPNYCRGLDAVLSPGGFSEYTAVHHSEYRYVTPSRNLDFRVAVLHEPLSCALRIVERAHISPADKVVVIGLGPMGAMSALLARVLGAREVIGVDRNPARIETARALGIACSDEPDPSDQERRVTGADVVIEVTGSPGGLDSALRYVALGGRVVVGSVYERDAEGIDLGRIMRKEVTVVGAKGSYPHTTRGGHSTTTELLERSDIPWEAMVAVYSLRDAEQAFNDMIAGKVIKPVIAMRGS